jgi:hypothetical protein
LGDKTMTVTWSGSEVGSFLFSHRPEDTWTTMRWEYHKFVVQGTGEDELRFTSTTGAYNGSGPVVDDISVVAIPDPLVSIRVSQILVCWESEIDQFYQLEYSSAVTEGEWVPLGAELPGDGDTLCVNDLVSPDEPRRFYRVRRIH